MLPFFIPFDLKISSLNSFSKSSGIVTFKVPMTNFSTYSHKYFFTDQKAYRYLSPYGNRNLKVSYMRCRCRYCKSANVIKYGKRRNKSGIVQIFLCKSCGRFFSENTTYEKTKLKELAIKVSVSLHLSGLSYRTIQRHLEEIYGIRVSHVTIYNWVKSSCIQER